MMYIYICIIYIYIYIYNFYIVNHVIMQVSQANGCKRYNYFNTKEDGLSGEDQWLYFKKRQHNARYSSTMISTPARRVSMRRRSLRIPGFPSELRADVADEVGTKRRSTTSSTAAAAAAVVASTDCRSKAVRPHWAAARTSAASAAGPTRHRRRRRAARWGNWTMHVDRRGSATRRRGRRKSRAGAAEPATVRCRRSYRWWRRRRRRTPDDWPPPMPSPRRRRLGNLTSTSLCVDRRSKASLAVADRIRCRVIAARGECYQRRSPPVWSIVNTTLIWLVRLVCLRVVPCK